MVLISILNLTLVGLSEYCLISCIFCCFRAQKFVFLNKFLEFLKFLQFFPFCLFVYCQFFFQRSFCLLFSFGNLIVQFFKLCLECLIGLPGTGDAVFDLFGVFQKILFLAVEDLEFVELKKFAFYHQLSVFNITMNFHIFKLHTGSIFALNYCKIELMEEESPLSRSSRISRSSKHSSFYSLEKPRDLRHRSISKSSNLLNIMDIQVPESSYRGSGYMSHQDNRQSGRERSSNFSRQNYSFRPDIEEKDLNRNSNYKISHECGCHDQMHCHGQHCSCFLTPREICVIGQCCPKCIESKNHFLKSTRGWALQKEKLLPEPESEQGILAVLKQKNVKNLHYYKQVYANEPGMQNLVFCTCKKSHCQKKYCLCYQKGVKCGQYCNCLECLNKQNYYQQDEKQEERRWERYANYKPNEQHQQNQHEIDNDIDQFMSTNLTGDNGFSETMEFQPPNFQPYFQHTYQ